MLSMLEGQKALAIEEAKAKWEAVGKVVGVLGPAGPVLGQYLGRFLGAAPSAPAEGDKSPRACFVRVLIKLRDGSEASTTALEMLEAVAGEDWPGVLAYLSEQASAYAAEQASGGATAQGVQTGHA